MELLEAVLLINRTSYTTKVSRKIFEYMLSNKDYKMIGKPDIVCIGDKINGKWEDKYARLYELQYKKECRILVYDPIQN